MNPSILVYDAGHPEKFEANKDAIMKHFGLEHFRPFASGEQPQENTLVYYDGPCDAHIQGLAKTMKVMGIGQVQAALGAEWHEVK